MNSHIITDRHAIIRDNLETVKACVNATLDELYDFIEALTALDEKDPSINTLKELADEYECTRRDLLADELNTHRIYQIEAILQHRLKILTTKRDEISVAIDELSQLIKSMS